MEIFMDPSLWIGFITLVVLEIILGIDNLVFVAILADKLPEKERDKARVSGLMLALLMRLALLATISWIVTLTQPLFDVGRFSFSGRDLIMLAGGLFLLFKATTELHERLEGDIAVQESERSPAEFWVVVTQIVILDAVFSLDSVITAVGMVNNLPIMMAAVIVAMGVMLLASKPLTLFINAHPTIVVLCLSFLLMIGLSLVAEGLGFYIPKGYLYAAIGFSIVIEIFNQIAHRNWVKSELKRPLRQRTAEAIVRLLGSQQQQTGEQRYPGEENKQEEFAEEERYMISGVLTLSSRSLRTIMTPRNEVSWINCQDSPAEIRKQLLATPHGVYPVSMDSLDNVLGVVRAKDVLLALEEGLSLSQIAASSPAIRVPEEMGVLELLDTLRWAKGRLVIVVDQQNTVQGVVTTLDVLEAIAGEFPDEDETPEVVEEGEGWLVKGSTALHRLEQVLQCYDLVTTKDRYASLAGLLLAHSEKLPTVGETFLLKGFQFEIVEMLDYRIERVRIQRL